MLRPSYFLSDLHRGLRASCETFAEKPNDASSPLSFIKKRSIGTARRRYDAAFISARADFVNAHGIFLAMLQCDGAHGVALTL
jgi:hypothetical protein